jgi:hypothetical protein
MSSQALWLPANSVEVIPPSLESPRVSEDFLYTGFIDPQDFYDNNALDKEGLPVYHTEVEERVSTNITHIHPGIGQTKIEDWYMSNGTHNHVLLGKAADPIGKVVVKDTAWGTQPEGFNLDVALHIMNEGWDIVIVGPQIGPSMDLAENAHITHKILDKLQEDGDFATDEAAVEGYSRGTMIGFGTVARAHLHGRSILFFNATDGCVATPIEINLQQGREALRGSPAELGTFARNIGKLVLQPKKAWQYRKTIDASWNGAKQFHNTGKPLMTGEAGILAGQMPQDIEGIAAFFLNSFANGMRDYHTIIKGEDGTLRPGMEFKYTRGGHVQALEERILNNIGAVFGRLGSQIREGRSRDEINYAAVRHAAVN